MTRFGVRRFVARRVVFLTPYVMQYDIIIIGTGAGGGTIARTLAPSGLRILILERGEYLPRERENWDEKAVCIEKRYQADETWYDKDDKPFQPYTHYCVGGNTKMYGAALLRLRETDFGEVGHVGGVSPAWPLSYTDLEPFYTRAEGMYHVRGSRGLDPTEPRASAGFDEPPLEPEPVIAEWYLGLQKTGYKPFPIPLGVKLPSIGAPVKLSAFDGYPDPTHSKADSEVCGIEHARQYDNVRLMTGWRVERLEVSGSGSEVREVIAIKNGERRTFSANVVVLAAGAINSAALLLRSNCAKHKNGLANSSGLVGRNYMCHQNGLLIAVADEANPSQLQKHFGIADFYHKAPGSDCPLGLIQLMGKPDVATLEWLASLDSSRPLGDEPVDSWRTRTIDFFLSAEDLPDPSNRVELRSDGSVRLVYSRNNAAAYDGLREKCEEAVSKVAAARGRRKPTFLHSRLGISGTSHQNGTLRFGGDPRTSVLDVNCKAHDLDNLYVVDASFFPSCGAVNPSLTIIANAIRVGELIAARMAKSVASRSERAGEVLVARTNTARL